MIATLTDIARAIADYNRMYEITYDDTLEFIASRDSLETAAGLLGIMPWNGPKKDAEGPLLVLSAFLRESGYEPPKQMWCRLEEYVYIPEILPDKLPEPVPFVDATPENFYMLREQGYSMKKVARAFQISMRTFYRKLRKWGIQ